MSWSIQKIGKRAVVRAAVQSDTNIPQSIKTCILEALQDEPSTLNGVRVEGYGHQYTGEGSYYSNIGKLEVMPLELIE
jgi:hypothetical protein